MRAVGVTPLTLLLWLILCWPAPLWATDDGEDSDPETNGETEQELDDEEERAELIRADWSRRFAPPEDHNWEIEGGWGWSFWENAYGSRNAQNYGRLRLRRLWRPLWATSVNVDASRRISDAGPVDFKSQRLTLTAATGLHWWSGRWLLGADVEGGTLFHRRTVEDGIGEKLTSTQRKALIGVSARAGVSLYGTSSLSLEYGSRWHTDRRDRLLLLQFAWLF